MEGYYIVVMDRGFVKAARVKPHPDLAFHWLLTPCRTVRVWGTTQGLAELTAGPTDKTVLDQPTVSTVPFRAVLELMEASPAWEKHLSAAPPKRTR